MKYIGKSKISTLHSKPGVSYPLIRLPQQYKHLIGETAQLFLTNQEGKKGFFIVLEESELKGKVVKQSLETNLESHLSALESSIEALKSKIDKLIELNFQNNELIEAVSTKKDGLDRIRTGDLRRVKAMSLLDMIRNFKAMSL